MIPWNAKRAIQLYDRTARCHNWNRRRYWSVQLSALLQEMTERELAAYRRILTDRATPITTKNRRNA